MGSRLWTIASPASKPFRIERYGNIAHYGAATRCTAMASKSRAASTAFKRSKQAGGWRVTGIMVQAESVTAPLPKEYLPLSRQAKSRETAANESAFQKREALQEIGPLFLGQTVLHSQETTVASHPAASSLWSCRVIA